MTAVSRDELNQLVKWIETQRQLPPEIAELLKRVLAVYQSLTEKVSRAKQTLETLRRAMGFAPKTERGSSAPDPVQQSLSLEDKETIADLEQKRSDLLKQSAIYAKELSEIRKKTQEPSRQLEFNLADPFEMVFSFPSGVNEKHSREEKVKRMHEFGKTSGLHSSYDRTKRVELQLVVKNIEYDVETVTDFETGKTVRASMDHVGPANFQMTWGSIANLMKMHVGFAIPMNRLSMMIGQPEFAPSQIYRVLKHFAGICLPVYLQLADEIAESKNLLGDDTPTKVQDLREKNDPITDEIDERLGWSSPRADGKGQKKALNVSLLIGKTQADDPRSTSRFFRTHVGGLGNLLTKILESRTAKAGSLTFQGDLSTVNLTTEELREKFKIKIAGCGAHARRPFFRYRADDDELCYFMLRGFLRLSYIESKIDEKGRTQKTVLKYRGRYGKMIWQAMRNRCQAAVTGDLENRNSVKVTGKPQVWPPNTELHSACKYLINNFVSLTLYLSDPTLKATNNGSERGLRIEKCMLSSSKFRMTRTGRAVLDILRTINATCTAAQIDPEIYLREIAPHLDDIQHHPELYTPFVIAKKLTPDFKPLEKR